MAGELFGARQKRLLTYAIAGFLPMISMALGLFITGDLMISFIVSFAVACMGLFLVHKVTMNALSRLELDGLPMIAPLDSLGTIHFYNVIVSSAERIARARIDGQDLETIYTRENIFNTIFHKTPVPGCSYETHDHILIPKKDGFDSTFSMHAAPTFFYNRRTKTFWTKSGMGQVEDGSTLESMVAYLNYTVKESGKYMKAYVQSLVDKLLQRVDIMKEGAIVLILLAIFALILFGPKLWESFSGVTSSAAGALAPSLPVEASGPIIPGG